MPEPLPMDGDTSFPGGMDSASAAMSLPEGFYSWSVNMLNRDGVLKTRPGYRWLFTLPNGKLQGIYYFQPSAGLPVIVCFVDGVPYSSNYPYHTAKQVPGDSMSADADYVYAANATQSVTQNTDGSLTLITPRNLLVCQDGINPPGYFDGHSFTSVTGLGGIPQGTHIAWAGARLWTARGRQVFASDIANPLSFTEQTYNTLGGISYFLLPDDCTGLAPLPGAIATQTPLLAFTSTTTTMFQANILNRSLWPNTPNFQNTMFPTLGNVAPRSISSIGGLLRWFSNIGFIMLDAAQASQLSNRMFRIDQEMTRSARHMFPDMSRITAGTYENFVLVSVPYASKYNTHTWVYDASVDQRLRDSANVLVQIPPVWSSVWTGVNPVQWTSFLFNGLQRLFCASVDSDGGNRVYEAFTSDVRDNGCDFVWAFESRGYSGKSVARKKLRYLEYKLSEMSGEVNLNISWAGTSRGRWKSISTPTFYAEEGCIDATKVIEATDNLFGLKKQSRTARTPDLDTIGADEFSSAGVEGPAGPARSNDEAEDVAFQFRFEGSGPCAIRTLRVFMDPLPDADSGEPDVTESANENFVRFDGAANNSEESLNTAAITYTGNGSFSAAWNNFTAKATATVTGSVSQADSDKRAAQVAAARAQNWLENVAGPYVGGKLT